MNLTGCPNLRTVDISNTGLTGCQLPENSGSLEYFDGSKTNGKLNVPQSSWNGAVKVWNMIKNWVSNGQVQK